jgi:signal transduction histidine kinase
VCVVPIVGVYRIFFNLFSGHVASIITTATAREEERKRAEALAELDRAKTIFFSNISHEFRTPLTLMLGPLEDLLDQAELQVEKEQLTLIHRNVLRLYKLVNSLLDFSRLEAGRARAVYEPVDLCTFTQDLASIFRSATERYVRPQVLIRCTHSYGSNRLPVLVYRAGLELIVECQELEQPVYVDKDMWEKIVLNLLSNALKFTMHGHIRVGLSPQPGKLTISSSGQAHVHVIALCSHPFVEQRGKWN